jgi:putative flippase GtrA
MVEKTSLQLFRYIIFGIPSSLSDIGVFMLCIFFFQGHYLIAQTFSFLAGIVVSYFFNAEFVFPRKRRVFSESLLFLLMGIIGLLLSYALLWLFVDVWSMTAFNMLPAKLFTGTIVFVWNFTSKKYIVFEAPTDRSPS